MSERLFRRATTADIDALSDLASRAFFNAFSAQIDREELSGYIASAFSPAKLEEELTNPDSTFIVCESNAELLGYARTLYDSVPATVPVRSALRLVRLYIDTNHIGTGLGYELLQNCDSLARKNSYDALWLRVWEHNRRAIRFYERNAFECCGTIDFSMLSSNKTDWIMWRRTSQ